MIFDSPSLSRAETNGGRVLAFKTEFGRAFHRRFIGSTGSQSHDSTDIRPKYRGNLEVVQGDYSAAGSAAYRFMETAEAFLQGEIARVAGTSSSVWLLGCRKEMEPDAFTPFLEGGIGLLDVSIQSVIDVYKVTDGIFFGLFDDEEYLGSESIGDSKFLLFPHLGGGLRAKAGSRVELFAKLRTVYLQDGHDVGAGAFLNSAGAVAEVAIARRLFVNAAAEISTSTFSGAEASHTVGLGFTIRP